MLGNVWEWTEDCANKDHGGAPTDGSAWLAGDCRRRMVRSGAWMSYPWLVRAGFRFIDGAGVRVVNAGIRVAGPL